MTKLLLADKENAKQLSHLFAIQKIRRIYRGIYTDNLTDALEEIVIRYWTQIVSYVVPKAILSYRSAFDLKPLPYKNNLHIVFLTSSYAKEIQIHGLILKIYKGSPDSYYEQMLPEIAKSNLPRTLLENLTVVKSSVLKGVKTIGKAGVEKYIARELQFHGENRLNQIREEAKRMVVDLHFEKEYKQLSQMISALLSTKDIASLESSYAIAVAKKEPFDDKRLRVFEELSLYLKNSSFIERPYPFSMTSFRNLSFFESYFSNFIEGTEFIIDEAEEIVFRGTEINNRHADSHDVLANFYLSNDFLEMGNTPKDAVDLLTLLQARHAYLMKERPEKNPGKFKDKPNKAGNTFFVAPEDVIGTLTKGFEIYSLLNEGLPKAIFMHYLISEVHPFDDGNGRLSRIMMNAELVKSGLFKIIVPTVCRENYLNGLRLVTRGQYFSTYCKVIDQLQAYTASVPWAQYGDARSKIELDCANLTADEGLPFFNRVLRGLDFSQFS